MATSSLDPTLNPRPDRELFKGQGTEALGPSDTSDSGSDVVGGPGFRGETGIGLDNGTTSDREGSLSNFTAGPDVGDADLSSDSDSTGTGEDATAGRDTVRHAGQDIDTDHIEHVNPDPDMRDDDRITATDRDDQKRRRH